MLPRDGRLATVAKKSSDDEDASRETETITQPYVPLVAASGFRLDDRLEANMSLAFCSSTRRAIAAPDSDSVACR